jgi:DedD protein
MAERKTEDDFNPRHRIVGAVILVALAVIFLPLLLQDRPPEKEGAEPKEVPVPEVREVAPAKSAQPRPDIVPKPVTTEPPIARPNTRTVTVALDPADISKPPAKKPATEPTPITEPPKAAAKPEPAPAKPEPKTEPKAEPKPEAKKPEATEPRASGWFVQVGVFSQAGNAKRLHDKLRAAGYNVVTDPPRIEKGKTIKVEVGPYSDQAAAKTAAARIKTDFSIDGVVRKH